MSEWLFFRSSLPSPHSSLLAALPPCRLAALAAWPRSLKSEVPDSCQLTTVNRRLPPHA